MLTTNIAGPSTADNDRDGSSTKRSRLDRMPELPPGAAKPARKSLMSRFDRATPDTDPDSDADTSAVRAFAGNNPLFAAMALSQSITKKLNMLGRFAPKTAANLQMSLQSGLVDELMGGGQSSSNPQFQPGAPGATQPGQVPTGPPPQPPSGAPMPPMTPGPGPGLGLLPPGQ